MGHRRRLRTLRGPLEPPRGASVPGVARGATRPPVAGRRLRHGAPAETVLALAAPGEVVGIDPSPAYVAFARDRVNDPRVRFEVADAQALQEAPSTFDAAVSGLVLTFVPEPERAVSEMANEVLLRQAKARADRSGEPIEEAMRAVVGTEAGKQLRELRDGPHAHEGVEEWQVGIAKERARERAQDIDWHLGQEVPQHPTHG